MLSRECASEGAARGGESGKTCLESSAMVFDVGGARYVAARELRGARVRAEGSARAGEGLFGGFRLGR